MGSISPNQVNIEDGSRFDLFTRPDSDPGIDLRFFPDDR